MKYSYRLTSKESVREGEEDERERERERERAREREREREDREREIVRSRNWISNKN